MLRRYLATIRTVGATLLLALGVLSLVCSLLGAFVKLPFAGTDWRRFFDWSLGFQFGTVGLPPSLGLILQLNPLRWVWGFESAPGLWSFLGVRFNLTAAPVTLSSVGQFFALWVAQPR